MRSRLAPGLWIAISLAGCADRAAAPAIAPEVVIARPSAEVPSPAPPPAIAQPEPTLVGRWEGRGRQSDGPTWTMAVEITRTEPGTCATISYPSLDCGGTWECIPTAAGRHVRAIEHITRGNKSCIDGGTVDMELSKDGETLLWTWGDARSELSAEARLYRARADASASPR